MVIRQFKHEQYERICRIIEAKGHREPMDVFYTMTVRVDDWVYYLRVLPTRQCKVAVLQTIRRRPEEEQSWELFTHGSLLSALLEIAAADAFIQQSQ